MENEFTEKLAATKTKPSIRFALLLGLRLLEF
jgi:hypothetical protein